MASKIPILFAVMSQRKITQKQLGDSIGVSTGNISDWKSGRSAPNIETLPKIADFFDCSIDYLLGRTDNPHSHKVQVANTVNGNYNAVDNSSVTIGTLLLDEHQKLLIELYNKMSPIEQVELLHNLTDRKK